MHLSNFSFFDFLLEDRSLNSLLSSEWLSDQGAAI